MKDEQPQSFFFLLCLYVERFEAQDVNMNNITSKTPNIFRILIFINLKKSYNINEKRKPLLQKQN
ncbi:MAG: hypothetical protein C0595_07835 [Marinilabiliales bacterium]|nr:MAG: hypothetical protein C0595_07835 [Marinilabiliales bacterium]